MSRIGKNPITVPDGVSVEIAGVIVTAKGKLGELSTSLTDNVVVTQEDNQIWVKPKDDSRDARKMWGTSRSVIDNLVVGVSEGFEKKLEINGVGYRAQIQGKSLNLQLGFSHDVNFEIPDGITIKCPDQTHIEISGADKQSVGQVAAVIRAYRPPEPYKGKGIKYADEYILRKEGKKK
ncbi:MAG: 50S ribosomal protein L6 [Rhodospirillaceae bacterium]|jgi:large subunit ribosomal protein L6|nr:50S ribosomal protein L6 [Rhodospirillales bacterium]MBT5298552.1 50S ribosomal protein L6 [Rhodospirillaceae bacterium]MBT6084290.1 50S ribosomal protein L6 [Rhodospirillaceae bacterium]MBT6884719.1 50S ribosomal protein L6 [Rhodospirillaceae bacterium]